MKLIQAVALAATVLVGCGTCSACGRGPNLELVQAGGPNCISPCGTSVWVGKFGPADCALYAHVEQAALDCANLYNYGGKIADPQVLCRKLHGSYLVINDGTNPPYGNFWLGNNPVIEILYGGADWRQNTWAHEVMGHAIQWAYTGDADQNHLNFRSGPGGIFDAMRCTQDQITNNWRSWKGQ